MSTNEIVIDRSESQLDFPNGRAAPANGLAVVESSPVSLLSIMDKAVSGGMPPESLEKLFALYERMEKHNAEKAFYAAMAGFKADCPAVPRRTENPQFQVTRDGRKVNRKFASIEDIGHTARPHLAAHGLSYDWGSSTIAGGQLTIPCIVSHAGGHSKATTSTVPIESKAGCSEQQKVGTAEAYAMRYSLIKALGLTSCDEDNDGNDEGPAQTAFISEENLGVLETLIADVGANAASVCKVYGVPSLKDLPASMFRPACQMCEAKRGAKK